MIIDFRDSISGRSEWCRPTYSADCFEGNSFSHTKLKSRAKWMASPSTSDVSNVTVAALRLPAGRLTPILSSFSLSIRPPFFDLALRKMPPSNEAFKHSGGDSLRCTSPTVTLYFELELRSDNLPGTWQKTSDWLTMPPGWAIDGRPSIPDPRPTMAPLQMDDCALLFPPPMLPPIKLWLLLPKLFRPLELLVLLLELLHDPDEEIIEADMTRLGSLMSSRVADELDGWWSGVVEHLLILMLSFWLLPLPMWWLLLFWYENCCWEDLVLLLLDDEFMFSEEEFMFAFELEEADEEDPDEEEP